MDKEYNGSIHCILFLLPTLKLTGGNLVVQEYCKILSESGIEVQIIGFLSEDQKSIFSTPNVTRLKYSFTKNIGLGLYLFPELIKIGYWLRKYKKYQPVTIYTPLAFILVICYLIGLCRKPKLIVHDSIKMRWVGWVSIRILLPIILKILGKKNVAVITEDFARENRIKSSDSLMIIKNGISASFFEESPATDRKMAQWNHDGIYLGSQSFTKGWDVLVREMKIICKSQSNISVSCVLAEKSNFDPIINSDRFKIEGIELTHVEIAKTMKNFSFFISTSRADSFGLPIVEAMAANLAPICSITQGSLFHAKKGAKIIFLDINKEGDLLRCIKSLMDMSDHERLEILRTNRNYASSYSWDNSMIQLKNFLLECSSSTREDFKAKNLRQIN